MPVGRRHILPRLAISSLAVLLALASTARATLFEPNNTPNKAVLLPAGQLVVVDSLSANVARPDPLLGEFDPTFHTILATNDNTQGVGDGHGSQLLGLPLLANGSAFFRVTGTGDTSFNGSHTQNGSYRADFTVYNSVHAVINQISQIEDVRAGMVDNLWINPSAAAIGGSVDVTISNLPYPPTGDAMDFFWFSGLGANKPFTAQIDMAGFNPILGVFDSTFHLLALNANTLPVLHGVADAQGRALIGVTGLGDNQFQGAHLQAGPYTLEVLPTPEPQGVALASIGAMLASLAVMRLRRMRDD
jgi:hypothetical protein